MLKLYYTVQQINSHSFLSAVLEKYHGIAARPLLYGMHGKPQLADCPIYFSLTHSGNLTAVAVCDKPVGLDAEYLDRRGSYTAVFNRLSLAEQEEITDMPAFLAHWTAKESYIKFRGETLAALYKKLTYIQGVLRFLNAPLAVSLQSGFLKDRKYIFTVCTERPEKATLTEVVS